MGSSSYITNLDGEVVQHIEYEPFGEVFVEERNNIWNTPYLFNAKEFDEETGLYYYGARYYDPRLSLWISVDPLSELDLQSSSYAFCGNNPINRLDSDGQIWETIWDVVNLVYDVGAAVYHHVTGNHDAAKGNWVDAGADVVATLLPFVPAGSTKLLKGGATVAKGLDKASDVKKWSEKYGLIKPEQKFLPSREHWEFHLMTNKKDTIIARYDVAFSISQESKRAQRYLYEDLTDEY